MKERLPFLILLLIVALQVSAQQARPDTVVVQKKRDFRPAGLRVGGDLISFSKSQFQKSFTGWELTTDLDIHRYLVTAEVGSWGRTFSSDSASYHNQGNYWRFGIDANFLTRDAERNAFFLGMRYGHSTYDEQVAYTLKDKIWGTTQGSLTNTGMKAHWVELTMGLKVKVYKFIWMGYTGRLKFGLKKNEHTTLLSSDVPGYGRTDRDNTFGFNYYVMFRIPFRKTTSILPPDKKK
jgi:hypothetical protein